jgi:hypothetical protein
LTFDGTLISDMSLDTSAPEELAAKRLTTMTAVKRTFSKRRSVASQPSQRRLKSHQRYSLAERLQSGGLAERSKAAI